MSTYLETLASYLPALLRQQLSLDSTPLTAPRADSFPAAFLFGDITGFTPLTLRLAQKSSEGVEELSRLLNSYFDRLISLITEHGGDIIKIAGDGVLVIWPSRENNPEATILRAAQCALMIQATLHNYETFEGARLAMRIGLGYGELTLAQLGGVFGRWEALATGQPIVQAGQAEGVCQPGQVILSPEAWALTQASVQVELVEKDGRQGIRLIQVRRPLEPVPTLLPELPARAETAARAYIPGAILQRLTSGQTGFLAELRRLTVIFVNLPGFENLTSIDKAQTLMETLQKALYHYEGSVNQLIMDEKGTTLVAALGLPPLAHEDDPARSLLAALEIAAGLRSLDQPYAIGVASGHVFCGERGNAFRREYALLGDAVNMAARLMQSILQQGASDILCDAVTWQAARQRLECESLSPIQVKGKLHPVPVYRPLSEKSAVVQAPSTLVGRKTEKNILSEALQDILRGDLQGAIILEGEAGLGKSRLVEDVRRQAEAMEITFLSGNGDAIERTTAYHAWRNVLRQGFGLNQAESHPEQRQKIETQLPPEWKGYISLLNTVLPLDFPETAETENLIPQMRLDKTRELLECLLLQFCNRPATVLVLEDAHWFDTSSWALVALACRVARRVPLLLVLTTRTLVDVHVPEYIQLLEQPETRYLRLSPLNEAEMMALVRQRLQVPHIGPGLKEFIWNRSEGNPFFAVETLWALREADLLAQPTPESCDLKPGIAREKITLPETVQGLILNRVDRLSPEMQMTLKVASVLGRVFSAEMVAAIYPAQGRDVDLQACLRTLEERDFIVSFSISHYLFKHALIRDAVYNQMLFSQRRTLHRSVAHWVESTQAHNLEPHYALLADHCRQAIGNLQEDPALTAKALDYLELAGEQASARLTYPEAVEFFSRAFEIAEELPPEMQGLANRLRKMRWLTYIGRAQKDLGLMNESCESLERAVRMGGYTLPQNDRELYGALLNELIIQFGHRLRPAFLAKKLSAEQEQTGQLASESLTWLFPAYQFKNTMLRAMLSSFKAVNIAENLKAAPLSVSISYSMLAFFCHIALPPAEKIYQRLAEKSHVPTREPVLENAGAVLVLMGLLGHGQWAQVEAGTRKALAMFERYATAHRVRALLIVQQGFTDYFQGRYNAQLEKYELLGQVGRMGSNSQAQLWEQEGKALVHHALGEFDGLLQSIQSLGDSLSEGMGAESDKIYLHTFQAWYTLARQDWKELEFHISELEKKFSRSPFPVYYDVDGKTICAMAYLILWKRSLGAVSHPTSRPWKLLAWRACKTLERFAGIYPLGRPAALRCLGDYAWLSGNLKQAQKYWQESLQAAEDFSMPREAALAHWALARLPDDETQQIHRKTSQQIFESLGAGAYFAWLEKFGYF